MRPSRARQPMRRGPTTFPHAPHRSLRPAGGGVPTVVHLHGGVHAPDSDGHSLAWFTSNSSSTGPKLSRPTSSYPSTQAPGSSGIVATPWPSPASTSSPASSAPTPSSPPTSHPPSASLPASNSTWLLIVFDRSFHSDGSIYMNSTGDNPQWQPEYFGDAIIVKARPGLSSPSAAAGTASASSTPAMPASSASSSPTASSSSISPPIPST